jgi:hypothetical protein
MKDSWFEEEQFAFRMFGVFDRHTVSYREDGIMAEGSPLGGSSDKCDVIIM